jgi:hypothetical protein
LSKGDYVQVRAVFHKEGFLAAQAVRVGTHRRLKMAVSIIAVIIVAVLLRNEWCVRGAGITLKKGRG